MPKRTGDFSAWRSRKLAEPANAANFLNAALEDSPEIFLAAVKEVVKARESVTVVASMAGVAPETLHRTFSASGNPTLDTLSSVLGVLGLRISITPIDSFGAGPKASSDKMR
jgi:probable addiction module antidote protein